MEIRRHTSSDYHAIAELRWQLKASEAPGLDGQRKREFLSRYLKHLQDCDKEGRTVHWLIDDGGTVLGVMTVRIVQKEPSPVEESESWGYLTNSVVIPEKRNLGLGSQLLEAVKFWATDLGLELLVVWPSEASYSFYRRAGFKGRDDPLELLLNPGDR
jgi:GNAT superfamily N-acetyltransferase